jgi:single-strand DNA-binding protein
LHSLTDSSITRRKIMSYQMHVIVGNVGGAPESRETRDGKKVTTFSVAVDTRHGAEPATTWYRVSCWNALADVAAKYLAKGRQVLVHGSALRASAYLKDGQPAAGLELRADRLVFLDKAAADQQTEAVETEEELG